MNPDRNQSSQSIQAYGTLQSVCLESTITRSTAYADPSKEYLHMGVEHFMQELQLDNHEQLMRICDGLEVGITDDHTTRPLVQLPKVILLQYHTVSAPKTNCKINFCQI